MPTKNGKRKSELFSTFEQLDQDNKSDVVMFGQMLLDCQRLQVTAITGEDWEKIPWSAKLCIVQYLQCASFASKAYKSALLRETK